MLGTPALDTACGRGKRPVAGLDVTIGRKRGGVIVVGMLGSRVKIVGGVTASVGTVGTVGTSGSCCRVTANVGN